MKSKFCSLEIMCRICQSFGLSSQPHLATSCRLARSRGGVNGQSPHCTRASAWVGKDSRFPQPAEDGERNDERAQINKARGKAAMTMTTTVKTREREIKELEGADLVGVRDQLLKRFHPLRDPLPSKLHARNGLQNANK